MSDTAARTLIKTATWQGLGFVSMTLIGLVVTGSATTGSAIAGISMAISSVCYILHERLWARIGWGRRAP